MAVVENVSGPGPVDPGPMVQSDHGPPDQVSGPGPVVQIGSVDQVRWSGGPSPADLVRWTQRWTWSGGPVDPGPVVHSDQVH